eukprot:364114-Chlamydomonas_euryale.AAC.9
MRQLDSQQTSWRCHVPPAPAHAHGGQSPALTAPALRGRALQSLLLLCVAEPCSRCSCSAWQSSAVAAPIRKRQSGMGGEQPWVASASSHGGKGYGRF